MKYFYPLIISLSVFFVWFVPKENADSTANVSFNKITKPTPKKIIVKSTKIGIKANNDFSVAYPHDGHAPLAPTITLEKSVAVQGGGNATPGGQLNYTVVLSNTAASGAGNNATDVSFSDVLNSNLTLVAGSVKATPIGVNDTYNVIGNVGITVPVEYGVLVNDVSPDGTSITVAVSTNVANGTLSLSSNGSFTYTPNAGFSGTDSFIYTVTSTNGTTSTNNTVTLTVSAPIWFVDIAAATNGNGTLASPFKDWSNFATANALTGATDPAANQTIFVYSGTYSGAATLKAGQKVLGQGATVGLASFAGATVQSYTNTLPSTSGTKPTLTSSGITITLNSNNTLRGFDMGNSTRDIAGTNFGTLTTTEMALTGNGDALSLSTGVLNLDFTSITSTNSVLNSISIQTCSGSFSGGNTSLSGGSGSSLSLGSNSASFTFGSLDITAGNGQNAINTAGQSGTITCTSGTISSNAANVITISGVSSVSKAPLAMVLTSVTKTGTAQTSALKLTNTSGSFTVNGSGTTAGSGGTITNVTEKGVDLNNVSNITLKNMNFVNASTTDATLSSTDYSVSNGGIVAKDVSSLTLDNISITGSVQRGISGHNVSNFSMTNCTVNNSGNNVNEGAIAFTNLSGTCSITGSTITRANEHLISIFNTSVNLNLTISNSNISDTQTTPAGTASAVVGTGILANTFGTGKTYITVSNCTLNKIGADAIKAINNDTSTGSYEITGCSIDPVNAVTTPNDVGTAIEITSNETSTIYTNIHDNTKLSANGGNVVTIAPTEQSTIHAKFTNNTVTYKSGGIVGVFRGIEIFGQDDAKGYSTITGNNISGLPQSNGIMVDNRSTLPTHTGNGRIDAIITGNTVALNYPDPNSTGRCIFIEAGNTTASQNIVCARVASNITSTNGINGHFRLSTFGATSAIRLEGSTDAATAWNANGNTPTTGNGGIVSVRSGSTVTMVAANTCIAPLNPPAFVALLADNKQIEEISNENARLAAIKKETLKDSLTAQEAISTVESKQTEKTTDADDLAISATQNSVADINAGETISVAGAGSGFTLPAGKSTTITFSAVISNSPSTCAITNTASVSGSNISTITSNTTTTNVVIPPPTGVTSATSICNGQSVSLSATCSSGEVQWYNAAATASLIGTGRPLSQSPSSNTTYQASCKVGECESTRVNTGLITVNALPVPAPSSNSPVCSGNTLNLSSAASTSYLWAGPNTFTSSLRNPSITSVTTAASGIYTITQTNSFGCTASATLSVTINQTPTASIGSNSPICSGSSLNLTSSGGDTYLWSGPNSFTSSLQNPSIANTTIAATGTYIVTITSNGCTATNSVVVTVNASPTPNPSSNSPVCSGNTLNLSSVTGMTTYAWSGPNSFTSSVQSPSISNVTTVEGGIYTVTVTNSNGCSASATTAVTINQTPTPNIGSNSPVNITNTLNLTSGTASTYLWAGPNSFTSSVQNPSITNVTTAATGTYTVTLTTNGCSASATTAVVISEATANSNSPVCTGNSLNLSSLGGGTYSWTGPNSFTSSSQNPSIANVTAAAAGTYTVTVTNGLSTATATTVVIVYTTPVPNPSSDSPKCVGTTLTFNSVAAMTSYTWTGPNSFSSSIQAPSI
ncbi:Ig-like domain-containing protein, partial [Emticicia sp. W12TSBA100-4]|uniref:beta strand repeat-containing protein n=1 Tax=Emticicia sp. W12TSBA100-4 TaxID=3160965 RepID=UPI003305908F